MDKAWYGKLSEHLSHPFVLRLLTRDKIISDTQNPPVPILRLCIFYFWGIFASRPPSPSNHQAFSSNYIPRSVILSNQLLLSPSIIASPTLDRHSFESASSVFIDHRLINPRSSLFRISFTCFYRSSSLQLSNIRNIGRNTQLQTLHHRSQQRTRLSPARPRSSSIPISHYPSDDVMSKSQFPIPKYQNYGRRST